MAQDNEETEIVEQISGARPKFTLVIILSAVLFILMMSIAAGGVFFYRQNKIALEGIVAVKKDLKEKNRVIQELTGQIEALSRQMESLKKYAIARPSETQEKKERSESSVSQEAENTSLTVPAQTPQEKVSFPVSQKPVATSVEKSTVSAKPERLDCQLVGKSPEEQAATLKRCVGVMDAPAARKSGTK